MNRQRAREKARRVPADALAPLVDDYIEWLGFVLWARAVVEAEGAIPQGVAGALQLRCAGFEPECDLETEPEFWLRLWRWIDHHIFRQPQQESWLISVEYYASRDLRWEQLWLYWEDCQERWQNRRPDSYPSFEEWCREAHRWRFPSPGRRRTTPDGAHRVTPDELEKAVSDYVDWEAFAYWVRAAMKAHRGMPPGVAERLRDRCPGFLEQFSEEGSRLADSTAVWRRLIAWMDDHVFGSAKAEGWFEAVLWYARSSLCAERTVAYWADCDRKWSRRRPAHCPDFEEWRRNARSYTEA